MKDMGLTQLITDPTRVTPHSSTTIDLIFTNSPHRVTDFGVIDLSMSDHFMIFCNRTCKRPRRSITWSTSRVCPGPIIIYLIYK